MRENDINSSNIVRQAEYIFIYFLLYIIND